MSLCLALAIVAFTGVHAMSGLRAEDRRARQAPSRGRAAARRHADARQGQRQPDRAAPLRPRRRSGRAGRDHRRRSRPTGPRTRPTAPSSRSCSRARSAEARVRRRSSQPRAEMLKLQKQALDATRAPRRLRNAEDRTGSRDAFEKQLLKLDSELEAAGEALAAATNAVRRRRACEDAHAADAAGTRLIIDHRARRDPRRDRARHLGHALGRAPGQGAQRPHDEPRRALPDRPRRRPRRRRRAAT